MMHRRLAFFATVVAFLLIQVTVAAEISIWDVKPDFLLAATVCFGLMEGPSSGALFGFASGFLGDIFSTAVLGVSAFAKTLIGFIAGTFRSRVISHSVIWPAGICFLASIFHEVIKFLTWKVVGIEGQPPFMFWSILWFATYNGLIVLAVYPVLNRIIPEQSDVMAIFNR
jgi:rod shape-determining protein MreD